MLQVALSAGEVRVVDVPEPALRAGCVRVRTSHSLISAGTESASIGSGGRRESLVVRALKNPALVKKVVDRVASHGLKSTAELVRTRIATEAPTGYSCAGVVTGVGEGVSDLALGDHVACAGAGHANHAAVNVVPRNLVARIPDGVSFEEAAFATLGAIALQGVRRAEPSLGDRVAVLGLGLLGQITVQMLKAAGAVVIGVDVRRDRVERAEALGLDTGFTVAERDFVAGVLERTDGRGADSVIVTAAGGDPELLSKAFEACRRKGRVVLVGDVPIRIQRDKIYRKEIDFLISTSYGPGRYDPAYEEKGLDYPFGYVRWTEGRNLEEVLRQIAMGLLRVRPLIDATHGIASAGEAYASLTAENRPIGILLDYHLDEEAPAAPALRYRSKRAAAATPSGAVGIGVVGYGSYFRSMLLPLLKAHPGFRLASACSRSGLTVRAAVETDAFASGTTDYRELITDPDVDLVYVATRHDLHYPVARAAVEAGKAVFVEKPMTTTTSDARELVDAVARKGTLLTVGFNRRFSPHTARLKELLAPIAGPKTLVYRVNAGALPPEHWLLDPAEGGGRLLGEGVHFLDMLRFLAASEPVRVLAASARGKARDEATVSIEFADGSIGALVYTGAGASSSGKERLEVFAGGASFVLDDFRSLAVHGLGKQGGMETRTVEKGQKQQLDNLYRALRGEAELGVTAEDGLVATWCAEMATSSDR